MNWESKGCFELLRLPICVRIRCVVDLHFLVSYILTEILDNDDQIGKLLLADGDEVEVMK